MLRLGILLSGRGSNFQAIWQALQAGNITHAQVAVVVSNKADAPGLAFAQSVGLAAIFADPKTATSRLAYDQALCQILTEHRVDIVVLAGYGRIITTPLLTAYAGRILNIHPSLLPAYGGKGMVGHHVHEAVLAAGETESGCTVHGVTEAVDGGPILGQVRVPVLPTDTPDSLAERVLAQEHQLYPQVLQAFIQQQLSLSGCSS